MIDHRFLKFYEILNHFKKLPTCCFEAAVVTIVSTIYAATHTVWMLYRSENDPSEKFTGAQ
jgi:hypothetical protein